MYREQPLLRPAPYYTGVHKSLNPSVFKITLSFTPFKDKNNKELAFQCCIWSARIALDLCFVSWHLMFLLQDFTVIFRPIEQSGLRGYLVPTYLLVEANNSLCSLFSVQMRCFFFMELIEWWKETEEAETVPDMSSHYSMCLMNKIH